jgi:uncharacterized membrane protein (DUF373 family)
LTHIIKHDTIFTDKKGAIMLKRFENGIIIGVSILLILVICFTFLQAAEDIVKTAIFSPRDLLTYKELLSMLGSIFMVLIGLELLETVKIYQQKHALHVELIVDVAIIALARKIIILDYSALKLSVLIGIAVLLSALALVRLVLKKI